MLKLTLSTDKVVVIRELTLGDQRSAAKNIGSTTNDAEMQIALQQELLKLLLVSIDGKDLKGQEKENLNSLFTWAEYMEIMNVIKELLGNEGQAKVEVLTE